jgi:hypothetical protein
MCGMRYKYVLLVVIVLFASCKKLSPSPQPSIVGKWFEIKHSYVLLQNGAKVGASTKTSFTNDDFAQYFVDGTGFFSSSASPAPSLSLFKYTLSGSILTQFNNGDTTGLNETVGLSANSLSVHYVVQIVDPANPNALDQEVDDFNFRRQ